MRLRIQCLQEGWPFCCLPLPCVSHLQTYLAGLQAPDYQQQVCISGGAGEPQGRQQVNHKEDGNQPIQAAPPWPSGHPTVQPTRVSGAWVRASVWAIVNQIHKLYFYCCPLGLEIPNASTRKVPLQIC